MAEDDRHEGNYDVPLSGPDGYSAWESGVIRRPVFARISRSEGQVDTSEPDRGIAEDLIRKSARFIYITTHILTWLNVYRG